MRLFFFSANEAEITDVIRELEAAGIPCEVRHSRRACDFGESEVWIHHDRDCHRALLLCVERGVGFARRPARSSLIEDWTDITNGTRFFEIDAPVSAPAEELPPNTRTGAHRMRKLKAA